MTFWQSGGPSWALVLAPRHSCFGGAGTVAEKTAAYEGRGGPTRDVRHRIAIGLECLPALVGARVFSALAFGARAGAHEGGGALCAADPRSSAPRAKVIPETRRVRPFVTPDRRRRRRRAGSFAAHARETREAGGDPRPGRPRRCSPRSRCGLP